MKIISHDKFRIFINDTFPKKTVNGLRKLFVKFNSPSKNSSKESLFSESDIKHSQLIFKNDDKFVEDMFLKNKSFICK
jgi:hypothetical protein